MKITRAMELIAASRIVKAQQRVEAARPYADLLTQAMEDVARQTGSLAHPLLEEREHPPARRRPGDDLGPRAGRLVQRQRDQGRREG